MRILIIILWTAAFTAPAKKGELVLQIQNIETVSGVVQVAIYDNEQAFLQNGKEMIKKIEIVQAKQDLEIAIPDLPFGTYAIAIYHDVNNNGKLDKNYFGIPNEPYAFSNNPKVKWRSPTFSESQVELNTSQKDLRVELKRWRKH